jgi:hypothetical protein
MHRENPLRYKARVMVLFSWQCIHTRHNQKPCHWQRDAIPSQSFYCKQLARIWGGFSCVAIGSFAVYSETRKIDASYLQ